MAATARSTLATQPVLALRSGSQPKSTATESSLWELAAKELDKKDYDKNNVNIVNQVLESMQTKKDICITNQWSYIAEHKSD